MLREFIRSIILVEGRVDDAKEKYPRLDKHGIIDKFVTGDPSGNNKYLMWMAREMEETFEQIGGPDYRSPAEIIQYVQDFHKAQQRLDKKDIMAYDEAEDVRDAVAALPVSKTQKKKKDKLEGAEKIYEDENFLLLHPKNKDAVCTYGKETKWCITQRDETHYEDYIKEGNVFYFLITKRGAQKIAFVWHAGDKQGINPKGLDSIFNAEDERIGRSDAIEHISNTLLGRVPGEGLWLAALKLYQKFITHMKEDVEDRHEELMKAVVDMNVKEIEQEVDMFNQDNDIMSAHADDDPWGWNGETPYYKVDIGISLEFPEHLDVDENQIRHAAMDATGLDIGEDDEVQIWKKDGENVYVDVRIEDDELLSTDSDQVIRTMGYYSRPGRKGERNQEFINALTARALDPGFDTDG